MTSITASIASQAHATPRRGRRAASRVDREQRRREDRVLVEGVLGGNEDAFRRLVERYERPLYWVAYDILLDAEEARDAVQETFIRVYAAIERFDLERDFLNWIFRIARNLAIDAYRRRRRRETPMGDVTRTRDGGEREAPDGLLEPDAADTAGQVAQVLKALPVEYRLALTLREFHGLSPREIAAVTDCSYPTARWRLHRARALFKQAWEERFDAPAPGGETA